MKKHRLPFQSIRTAAILLMMTSLFALILSPFASMARAAGTTSLSGRVYNIESGTGYANVTVSLCGAGNAVTGANGNWEASVPEGAAYCARIAGGAPALAGPSVRNNPEVGAASSYENQIAGVNCYHNSGCTADQQTWDRPIDGGLDFAYKNQSAVTPNPAPAATPAPAAASGAPTDFAAKLSDSDHKTVSLTWAPVGDPTAVKAYKLERSMDNVSWDVLADNLTDPSYQDQAAAPGVHYYYRLSAIDQAGTASDAALADVSTGDVLAAQGQSDAIYASNDKKAQAVVHGGTLPDEATCSINTSDQQLAGNGRTLKAGPYELQCKDSLGAAITDFKHPVSWQFTLGDNMKGFTKPKALHKDSASKTETLGGGAYDTEAHILKADAPGTGAVAVFASPVNFGWITYVAVGGIGVLMLVIIAIIPIRRERKMSYQEYLRAKYYNL